ncbi:MAG: hypothetical protein BWY68_00702 [bacterium ADurb.Bin400]|nr:MAG: hypothetical protein BWY68_00702 [bacterium ADurb.Bin400]
MVDVRVNSSDKDTEDKLLVGLRGVVSGSFLVFADERITVGGFKRGNIRVATESQITGFVGDGCRQYGDNGGIVPPLAMEGVVGIPIYIFDAWWIHVVHINADSLDYTGVFDRGRDDRTCVFCKAEGVDVFGCVAGWFVFE